MPRLWLVKAADGLVSNNPRESQLNCWSPRRTRRLENLIELRPRVVPAASHTL